MYEYSKLPESLQGGMKRYLENGISGGSFLDATLSNNLFSAVMRADATNLKELPNIVRWIHWEAPSNAHGSELTVKAWIDSFKLVDERKYVG